MDKNTWLIVLERLKDELPNGAYQWISQGGLYATHTPDLYILQVESNAIRTVLQDRCLVPIERAMTEASGSKDKVRVMITSKKSKQSTRAITNGSTASLFPDAEEAQPEPFDSGPSLAEALPVRGTAKQLTEERRRQRTIRQRNGALASMPPDMPTATAATDLRSRNGSDQRAPKPPVSIMSRPSDPAGNITLPDWINERYTFDTFIVGGGNHFAYAATMAVADKPAQAYNPLFLYGGVGLGKTHLLHALAHALAPKGFRVLYVTSETFTNEIINAIRYRTTEEFRAKYRNVDVLLVDDIQFIAGKDSTEEEFFHTFNALHGNHKQIVICSDRPPKEIDLAERLRSRFEWGLIVDIQPPDLETRLAILRTKAEALNIPIADNVLNYLGERIQTNVRELEGMLNRVVAFAQLLHEPLTLEIARQALLNLTPAEQPRRKVTVGEILVAISNHYHVTLEDLRGKQRDKHIVVPRQVSMWLMRNDTSASLMEIGSELGGRDHSTIIHGCEKIEKELGQDGNLLMQDVNLIRQQLGL